MLHARRGALCLAAPEKDTAVLKVFFPLAASLQTWGEHDVFVFPSGVAQNHLQGLAALWGGVWAGWLPVRLTEHPWAVGSPQKPGWRLPQTLSWTRLDQGALFLTSGSEHR